jgi:hypothetical protein
MSADVGRRVVGARSHGNHRAKRRKTSDVGRVGRPSDAGAQVQ